MKPSAADEISNRLLELAMDEVVSPLDPRCLAEGDWWPRDRVWPDELLSGLLEPRRGYRFRPENVALAAMLDDLAAARVVDLGSGSGSLLLLASYFVSLNRGVGVERQADMVDRSRRTLQAHGLERAVVVEGDLREVGTLHSVADTLGGPADLVVANPPYFPTDWGRPSSNTSTRLSTHGEHGDVHDFCEAAARLLATTGVLIVVFDAGRLASLLAAAGECGFGPTRFLWIPDQRPGKEQVPFRVWVEFRQGSSGATVEKLGTG